MIETPIATVQAGVYTLTLVQNDRGRSVSLQKKIRKNGTWEQLTLYMTPQDVPCVRMLCESMEREILKVIARETEKEPSDQQEAPKEEVPF